MKTEIVFMGDAVFEQMVGVMQRGHTPLRPWNGKIDREEYEQWRKDFIWKHYTVCDMVRAFVIVLAYTTIICSTILEM